MMPATMSMAMPGMRFETSSTKLMDIMAPANAAMIMTIEPMWMPAPRKITMTMATTSFAPDEMPSTNGPAMGLWKNVWSR